MIARAPLRISLGGGGTDLPAYYSQYGGMVIGAAIDKYVTIVTNRTPFIEGYALRYSTVEHVRHPDEIDHPVFREALEKEPPGIEIAVLADVPAGTGLGSSGAFTVALLRALHPDRPRRWLAEEAGTIEMQRLGRNVGEQDNYTAAYGGVKVYTFSRSGKVEVNDLAVPGLAEKLCLFYTGITREAVVTSTDLHAAKRLGEESVQLIDEQRYDEYGLILNEQWALKGPQHPDIDGWRAQGLAAGALGGKLVGAGGGGFLLFYTHDPDALRDALPLRELPFTFDQMYAETPLWRRYFGEGKCRP